MIRLTELLDESEAGDEARAKGLEYLSFGRYGKGGQVTHIVDPKTHKLVPKPAGEEPQQGSTAAKPSISRSPDGSRGSKTPLAQEPRGDYGNPDMPTSMPKSTAPQPVEKPVGDMNSRRAQYGLGPMPSKITGPGDAPSDYQSPTTSERSPDERWSELLKAREEVQKLIKKHAELGGRSAVDHWTVVSGQLDNKARQMAMKEPPQNQHLAQYLINRGLMQDPTDQEEPTPRDASGASHFGPDN